MNQIKFIGLALLGVLILGACSTSNDVVGGGIFQKRKYTGGVYWDRSEKVKPAKENGEEEFDIFRIEEESQKKYVSSTTIRNDEPVGDAPVSASVATTNENEISKVSVVSETSTSTISMTEESSSETTVRSTDKTKTVKVLKKRSNNAPASDVMIIVLVILAIIIPPLAVFIFEGVTGRFWIDLILAILGWGAFGLFGGIFWLCGLAAVIYALLIVLGVI
jgi:uncharacterized membrane protein YqaE (UPF0057 family)